MAMELLIPHACKVCGLTDEAQIRYAGPHLKQVCNNCGTYVKFFSKGLMPDHQEVKLKIWSITQDVDKIEAAKKTCGFVEGLTGLDRKIMYWRLYLEVRDLHCLFRPDDAVVTADGEIAIVRGCAYPSSCTISFRTDHDTFGDNVFIVDTSSLTYVHELNRKGTHV